MKADFSDAPLANKKSGKPNSGFFKTNLEEIYFEPSIAKVLSNTEINGLIK